LRWIWLSRCERRGCRSCDHASCEFVAGHACGLCSRQALSLKPRLLVTAPSNAAVDAIIQKVMEHGFLDGTAKRWRRVSRGVDACREVSPLQLCTLANSLPQVQPRHCAGWLVVHPHGVCQRRVPRRSHRGVATHAAGRAALGDQAAGGRSRHVLRQRTCAHRTSVTAECATSLCVTVVPWGCVCTQVARLRAAYKDAVARECGEVVRQELIGRAVLLLENFNKLHSLFLQYSSLLTLHKAEQRVRLYATPVPL
jgi:hypothetical protein